MAKYITKRVIYMMITLFLISTITFFLMRIAPGGPFLADKVPPQVVEKLNEQYGLNKPIYVQYFDYISRVVRFDFGVSMTSEYITTNQIIKIGFPVSAMLGIEAILLAVSIGVLIGTIAALKHNKWQDYLMNIIAVLGISVPSFIMATILQYVFAVKFRIFPLSGWNSFLHSVLPAIILSLGPMAYIAKLTRSSMLEQLSSEYVKLATAKGMSRNIVTYKHALRNAILPVVSYLGPLTAGVLTGSFIIESIFGIPGLGKYFVKSISDRDYTMIMGTTVFYSFVLMTAVLIVDILYGLIDPRIKLKEGE